jgi:mono/diheme cytochrome c family protein
MIVFLTFLTGSGCDFPGRPNEADRPIPANQVVDFATLYGQHCAGCHGAGGKLGPAPPLNDETFLAIVPDSVLLGVISEGRPGTPMPAFARESGGTLTDAQVKVLAEGLKPRWGKSHVGRGSLPPYSVAKAKASDSRNERGEQVFRRACAGCHGSEGQGGKKAGAINNPAFLALISDQALRRYAITGRPDLGMPDHAGKAGRADDFQPLTSAEIGDLVGLLARWRQTGSGSGSVPESAGGQ